MVELAISMEFTVTLLTSWVLSSHVPYAGGTLVIYLDEEPGIAS